jgi:hypothetical protein
VPGEPACTQCSAITISAPYVNFTDTTKNYQYPNSTLNLTYLSCNQCQNGYDLVWFQSTAGKQYGF